MTRFEQVLIPMSPAEAERLCDRVEVDMDEAYGESGFRFFWDRSCEESLLEVVTVLRMAYPGPMTVTFIHGECQLDRHIIARYEVKK